VEAQQCVKLTSTNRPFGLIIKLSHTVFEKVQRSSLLLLQFARPCAELVCQPISVVARSWSADVLIGGFPGRAKSLRASLVRFIAHALASRQRVSGDHTARVTPVPIPNTVVKPRRADDTARVTVWERRSSPGLNRKTAPLNSLSWGRFLFFPRLPWPARKPSHPFT
jgi:hypothetical protein